MVAGRNIDSVICRTYMYQGKVIWNGPQKNIFERATNNAPSFILIALVL